MISKFPQASANKLNWNVIYKSNNDIQVLNVFDHNLFYDGCVEAKKKHKNFLDFSKRINELLMWYFWGKYEYEIIITSFSPYIGKEEINRISNLKPIYRENVSLEVEEKIDVYTQIMLNWSQFINYLWVNRKLLR